MAKSNRTRRSSSSGSPWTGPDKRRDRRSAPLARRDEGPMAAALLVRGATQSAAAQRGCSAPRMPWEARPRAAKAPAARRGPVRTLSMPFAALVSSLSLLPVGSVGASGQGREVPLPSETHWAALALPGIDTPTVSLGLAEIPVALISRASPLAAARIPRPPCRDARTPRLAPRPPPALRHPRARHRLRLDPGTEQHGINWHPAYGLRRPPSQRVRRSGLLGARDRTAGGGLVLLPPLRRGGAADVRRLPGSPNYPGHRLLGNGGRNRRRPHDGRRRLRADPQPRGCQPDQRRLPGAAGRGVAAPRNRRRELRAATVALSARGNPGGRLRFPGRNADRSGGGQLRLGAAGWRGQLPVAFAWAARTRACS